MDSVSRARWMATARAGSGLAFLAAPRLALRVIGMRDDAEARFLAQAIAGRDLVLGLGALSALRNRQPTNAWFRAAAVADGIDLVAMLLRFRDLPRAAQLVTLPSAALSLAANWSAASSQDA